MGCWPASEAVRRASLDRLYSRVVRMHQHPRCSALAIDLRFAAIGLDQCAILPLRRCEVPVELGPRGGSIDVHLDVAGHKLPRREHPAHDVRQECLDLGPAVGLAEGMDKRHIRRGVPDPRGQFDVGCIHRRRIVRDELANTVGWGSRPAGKGQE
jgi:hypothetical protein